MGVKELTLSLGLDANASAALASTYPQIEKVIFISTYMSSYMSAFKYVNRLRTELSYSLHVKGIKRDLNNLRRHCVSMR
jgi:hypothetical protein